MTNPNNPLKGFRPLGEQSKHGSENSQSPQSTGSTPVSLSATPSAVGLPIQRGHLCPSCNRLNAPGSIYCNNCGATLNTPQPASPQAVLCPNCSTYIQSTWSFCLHCGYQLFPQTQPAPTSQPVFQKQSQVLLSGLSSLRIASLPNINQLWPTIAIISSVCTLICFFLPLLIMKISNPAGWLIGGPEKITFSMSAWQVLRMSSPTIDGLGGLGETAQNMYNEIDMGALVYDSADSSTQMVILLGRGLMMILGLLIVGAIVLSIQSYNKPAKGNHRLIFLGGIAGAIILIGSSLAVNAGFNSGSSDLDMILNSVVGFSNGLGFWGMLCGFIVFSLSGYMRK